MVLKRKRSMDSSPLSISSFGTAPTPEAQSPCPFPDNFDFSMDLDTCPHSTLFSRSWDARLSSSEMGSRTRKRFRDNRPDERVIHGMYPIYTSQRLESYLSNNCTIENTISKLFQAQRLHPHASPIPTNPPQPQQQIQTPQHFQQAPAVQKSTLHSFWKITAPAPPVQPPSQTLNPHHSVAPSTYIPPHCEDCDAPLHPDSSSSASAMAMDIDSGGAVTAGTCSEENNEFACGDCGRWICGTCAVVGDRRVCLGCIGFGGRDRDAGRAARRWW